MIVNLPLNKFSSRLTQVPAQVGSRAMLYGAGLSDDDMNKPQVGIVSMGWEGNPCNMHLDDLASHVKAGVRDAGLVGLIFHTIGVSDGIGNASLPASDPAKASECYQAGSAVRLLLEQDIKPSDILSRDAFLNAITVIIALGGSTNAVLHLLAIARTAGVQLSLDDFQTVSDRTPYIADLKPSGSFVMEDLHAVGGVPAVQKLLLKEGLLNGGCLTVTGKSLAENIERLPELSSGQNIIIPLSSPIKKNGHIQILYGNLAQQGAVAKITGKEGSYFKGPAKVYDSEEDSLSAIEHNKIQNGDVVVIRYEGPKGGPGMREMLSITAAIIGAGLGSSVALITDGRFSGGTHLRCWSYLSGSLFRRYSRSCAVR